MCRPSASSSGFRQATALQETAHARRKNGARAADRCRSLSRRCRSGAVRPVRCGRPLHENRGARDYFPALRNVDLAATLGSGKVDSIPLAVPPRYCFPAHLTSPCAVLRKGDPTSRTGRLRLQPHARRSVQVTTRIKLARQVEPRISGSARRHRDEPFLTRLHRHCRDRSCCARRCHCAAATALRSRAEMVQKLADEYGESQQAVGYVNERRCWKCSFRPRAPGLSSPPAPMATAACCRRARLGTSRLSRRLDTIPDPASANAARFRPAPTH